MSWARKACMPRGMRGPASISVGNQRTMPGVRRMRTMSPIFAA
jgi:hypothetical protein